MQSKHAANTAASPPARIGGIWRIAPNAATAYSTLCFLVLGLGRRVSFCRCAAPSHGERFLHGILTKQRAVPALMPHEPWHHLGCSSFPAPAGLLQQPPLSCLCPITQPQVPEPQLCQESSLQQPTEGQEDPVGSGVRDTGCATGGSKNLINCKKGALGKEIQRQRVSPKGQRRLYFINAA